MQRSVAMLTSVLLAVASGATVSAQPRCVMLGAMQICVPPKYQAPPVLPFTGSRIDRSKDV